MPAAKGGNDALKKGEKEQHGAERVLIGAIQRELRQSRVIKEKAGRWIKSRVTHRTQRHKDG